MAIEGFITVSLGDSVSVVGFTGTDLECEGCEAITTELYETDDSVMLCAACYKLSAEEAEDAGMAGSEAG